MNRKPFGFRIKEFSELSPDERENEMIPYEVLFRDDVECKKRTDQILNDAFRKGWLYKEEQ
jgi:hypothetical protein